jgi:hypothetical protein
MFESVMPVYAVGCATTSCICVYIVHLGLLAGYIGGRKNSTCLILATENPTGNQTVNSFVQITQHAGCTNPVGQTRLYNGLYSVDGTLKCSFIVRRSR